MADIILGFIAVYLGFKAANKVRSAYRNAKQEMHAKHDLANYYTQQYYNSPYPIGYSGRQHHSIGYHGGPSNRSGSSYSYAY